MSQTLVLNSSYEPLKVVPWERAITLWFQGKAEIIREHDQEIRAVTFTMKMPSVVRLLYFVKLKRRPVVQFTRANIYQRDEFRCQYCNAQHEPYKLTFDHVIPVAQGGKRGWTNIVTACEPCNRKKADRTPEQAGMTLLRHPRQPIVLAPTMKLSFGYKTPADWYDFMYWNVKLES